MKGERSPADCLTHNVCLALAAVVIGSADLHLYERTDDAAAVFREVASSQHLNVRSSGDARTG